MRTHERSERTPEVVSRVAEWAAGLLRVRWVVRAPIWLFRARLGAVFGSHLLLLEHVGRKTGATRRVVLEVVSRPASDRYVVASGFGEAAQWYRNVQVNARVRVQIGAGRPHAATARPLSSAERSAALAEYSAAHPRAWSTLRPVFESTLGVRIDQDGTSLPMVALELVPPAADGRPLTATIDIAAPSSVVWAVVSDVRRIGEWSPECRRVLPFGSVRRGCWLLGLNQRGAVRWLTLSRITEYRAEQEISWRVVTNGSMWAYRLVATADGTRLIQSRHTPNGVAAVAGWFIDRYLGGQDRHDDELEAGMSAGLTHIKAMTEAEQDRVHGDQADSVP